MKASTEAGFNNINEMQAEREWADKEADVTKATKEDKTFSFVAGKAQKYQVNPSFVSDF